MSPNGSSLKNVLNAARSHSAPPPFLAMRSSAPRSASATGMRPAHAAHRFRLEYVPGSVTGSRHDKQHAP